MSPGRTLAGVPDRVINVASRVRASALDNALSAAQTIRLEIAQRRALAPEAGGGRGDLAPLDRPECMQLLATRQLGRLAYVARAGVPDVVPVNYSLSDGSILIRSGPGPKLQAAERRDLVAFEVDDIDDEQHTGWSVVVVGRARRLSAADAERIGVSPLPWAAGPREHLIRIVPARIDGRRLS